MYDIHREVNEVGLVVIEDRSISRLRVRADGVVLVSGSIPRADAVCYGIIVRRVGSDVVDIFNLRLY
jgi:hypothetical protein